MNRLTGGRASGYYVDMIEKIFFLLGLGFSILVYYRSIRPADIPPLKKTFYFLLTLVGITGTVFLIGIMAAHVLSQLKTSR